MKTLYIVRHAKSSWDHPGLGDDERPLLQKGVKRTLKIARFLKEKNVLPDLLIASFAVRAHETARIIANFIGYPEDKILVTTKLYHASADGIYDELFSLSDASKSVMLFGHNPTFTSFANHFLDDKIAWLPTSGVVSITFETDKWTDISLAHHKINFVVAPKDL